MMLIFTACVFWIVFGSFSVFADGRPVGCCLKLRLSKLPFDKVLNYRIQTKALCPINAVVIQTLSGKRLCSDPNSDWTKRVMWKVDEAKKKAREQDPVPAERASTAGSRRRADPVTAIKLPLNSQWNRVTARQKSKRFQAVSEKRLCSDPKSDWIKRPMWRVDEAEKKPREPAEGALTEGSRQKADLFVHVISYVIAFIDLFFTLINTFTITAAII
uniref:Chemokine interleukin-8-like domain-containing protein n=1 Tax=Cyprinus carpio carpio TaxID=630221 RepID=A0A8C1DPL0_CYPCA